jgi:hypothetical protein
MVIHSNEQRLLSPSPRSLARRMIEGRYKHPVGPSDIRYRTSSGDTASRRHPVSAANMFHKGPRVLRTAHPHDIEDCEDLLENYFMQVVHSELRGTLGSRAAKVSEWLGHCTQAFRAGRAVPTTNGGGMGRGVGSSACAAQ